jgi:hypothetical protein
MKAKLRFAFILAATTTLAAQFTSASFAAPPGSEPAPTQAPSPAATLAPISAGPIPTPTAQGTATPKILGHQIVSAFCSTFVARFNVAATTMLADDKLLDDATAAETDYENDYSRLDGAIRSWNHRLAMIAALTQIIHTIPKTQAAVNELRAQATTTTDAERRAALFESASQLQTSIDHQRIVANELNDAVHATLDLHAIEDTIGSASRGLVDGRQIVSNGPGDAPIPHPGDALPAARKAGSYDASALEIILHMPRDRQLAADAESNAAVAVTRVVRSCSQETQQY